MAATRAAFAAVLADINGLQLVPRANYDLGRRIPRGFVFIAREVGSNNIYVSWSGSTRLAEIMRHLRLGNPRRIDVVAVLRRDNVHDARTIAETIINGLALRRIPGTSWFEVEDVKKVADMMANIDRAEL